VLDNLLPRLSPTARALLHAERSEREDAPFASRALERAQAALVGEARSGVSWARGEGRAVARSRSRGARGALLVAAAATCAGLAAAGVRFVTLDDSQASRLPEAGPPIAPAAPRTTPMRAPRSEAAELEADPDPVPLSPARGGGVSAPGRPSRVKQYAIELGLLEPARSCIARGDHRAALAAIARHWREYPNGQLAEERDALRVRALWGLGERASAERAAASFRGRYPKSALLSWLKDQPLR
jgi:hypothetical protein